MLSFKEKRRIYADKIYNYHMIEILNSDNIKDFLVYDEQIDYKQKLYKEVICLNLKKNKFSKSSIIGFNDTNIRKMHPPLYDENNKHISCIKLDHSILTPTIYLLNEKENEYPIIDSFAINFNVIIADMKKSLLFPQKFPKIPKTDIKNFKTLKIAIMSLDVLKDGRISINDGVHFYIYNKDFSNKEEIKFGFELTYHKFLKNGDLLVLNYPKIIRLTNNKSNKKFEIIQNLSENFTKQHLEFKDYLFLIETFNLNIWKYDKIQKQYIFIEKLEKYLENIFPIGKNKIMVSTGKEIICFQFDDKGYNKVLNIKNSDSNYSLKFFPNIYKKKYIFNCLLINMKNYIEIFNLESQMFIYNISFLSNIIIKQIFPLNNGNLLIVYYEDSRYNPNTNYKDNYKVMETVIVDRKIFIVKKFDIRVKSIISQLKNGTIIYNQGINTK